MQLPRASEPEFGGERGRKDYHFLVLQIFQKISYGGLDSPWRNFEVDHGRLDTPWRKKFGRLWAPVLDLEIF